jgi:1-deoxy-D-xylulose-5-phosphate reductoisomerase
MRKRIAVLGCTGSVGRQALEVVEAHSERFELVALAASRWSDLLVRQIQRWRPRLVGLVEAPEEDTSRLGARFVTGRESLTQLVAAAGADLVVMAVPGAVGLRPTLAALQGGANVALANKESLVMAGHLVMRAAGSGRAAVLPVDSEHNAIWQCLRGEGEGEKAVEAVAALILTASGGAFRDLPMAALATVTPQQALRHPNWSMGAKITVDSATLMNKGLEVIEAAWLFGVPLERIRVVMHRESIVHSLVEFIDGSVKAQLAAPDMRLPIQYALSYPERWDCPVARLDLSALASLTFGPVDPVRFRCMYLALGAAERGGTYPAVLAGADEEAVRLFLDGVLPFHLIGEVIEAVLNRHHTVSNPDLETVFEADNWARNTCRDIAVKVAA